LLNQPGDLQLVGGGVSHAPSSPTPIALFFFGSRFSRVSSVLQCAGLPAQLLDFLRGCGARRVAGQTLLAGLQKSLRPAIVEALDDPLAAAQFGDTVLAAQTRKDDADLLLRGKLPPGSTADLFHYLFAGSFTGPDFCPICAPSMATMGQKSSNPPFLSHRC
jgi:hypothetical protein